MRFWFHLPSIYKALVAKLIGSTVTPIVILDWSKVCDGMYALHAAVPCGGRAQIIYCEVYAEKDHGKPRVEKGFLKRLAYVLSASRRPILVTDAGYRGPWFEAVGAQDWDYVGRVRNNVHITDAQGNWFAAKDLFVKATSTAKDLGIRLLAKRHRGKHRFVLVKQRKRGRHARFNRRRPELRVNATPDRKARSAAKEPWLLATSLTALSAQQVVQIYAVRMSIEETFRDHKNPRFGWALRHARSRSEKRLEILFLIAAFASLLLTTIGRVAENENIHLQFQANTETGRRVLSHFFLGKAIVDSYQQHLARGALKNALQQLPASLDAGPF